jgi:hypothetical protein
METFSSHYLAQLLSALFLDYQAGSTGRGSGAGTSIGPGLTLTTIMPVL